MGGYLLQLVGLGVEEGEVELGNLQGERGGGGGGGEAGTGDGGGAAAAAAREKRSLT